MGECNVKCSAASGYLKFATAVLMIGLVLHIVGFSTPNWSTVHLLDRNENGRLKIYEGSDNAGLWQLCSCIDFFGDTVCSCYGRHGDPVWFKITQTMETITLIGFIISVFISMIQMFTKQDAKLKRINIFISIGTGICGILGITVYGIRSKNDIDKTASFFDQVNMEVEGYLDFSFYMCCVSVLLYTLVCAPLYIKDERIPAPTVTQQLPIVYNNQGQIVIPIEMHGAPIIYGQETVGYIAPYSPYFSPPEYTVDANQEPTSLQQTQSSDEIPYKE